MKPIKLVLLGLAFLVMSCSSVSVVTDYDTNANFDQYKTLLSTKKASIKQLFQTSTSVGF